MCLCIRKESSITFIFLFQAEDVIRVPLVTGVQTCALPISRENVDFFARANEALESGYRPCSRCHPLDPNARPPKLIERLRAEVERAPGGRLTDKELAALSIDPSTARRQFKRH